MNREQSNQNRQNDRRRDRDQSGRPPMGQPPMTPPGIPPQGPGREGRPMPPPGFPPQGPGMEGMPRTAPPNFTPEAPGMERTPMGGAYHMGPGGQGGSIRRCTNRFTYIWLRNGNNFWFYITFTSDRFIQGFRWRNNRWEFDRIDRNRIIYWRCF